MGNKNMVVTRADEVGERGADFLSCARRKLEWRKREWTHH